MISRKVSISFVRLINMIHIKHNYTLLKFLNLFNLCRQLGGFVEKYAGSGVTLHTHSSSNKENRRTEGLNRYLQALNSNPSSTPG